MLDSIRDGLSIPGFIGKGYGQVDYLPVLFLRFFRNSRQRSMSRARLFIDVFHQLVKQHADHAPLQDAQAAVGKLPVPDVPVSSYLGF